MQKSIQIITIEGNIGSGKSTLLENLSQIYQCDTRIVFLKEPVTEWDKIKDKNGTTMLKKFYEDQKKYSFSFQMMAYITRLAEFKMAIKANPEATIFFTERSLYTDKHVFAKMLYDMGNIEDVDYQIYTRWFDTFASDYTMNHVIYVRTSPEICFKRIQTRSRTGEESIPLGYLKRCHGYHETMIQTEFENIDTLTIDGNADIRENPAKMAEWLKTIHDLLIGN